MLFVVYSEEEKVMMRNLTAAAAMLQPLLLMSAVLSQNHTNVSTANGVSPDLMRQLYQKQFRLQSGLNCTLTVDSTIGGVFTG